MKTDWTDAERLKLIKIAQFYHAKGVTQGEYNVYARLFEQLRTQPIEKVLFYVAQQVDELTANLGAARCGEKKWVDV